MNKIEIIFGYIFMNFILIEPHSGFVPKGSVMIKNFEPFIHSLSTHTGTETFFFCTSVPDNRCLLRPK
jgi:hypothetical protein